MSQSPVLAVQLGAGGQVPLTPPKAAPTAWPSRSPFFSPAWDPKPVPPLLVPVGHPSDLHTSPWQPECPVPGQACLDTSPLASTPASPIQPSPAVRDFGGSVASIGGKKNTSPLLLRVRPSHGFGLQDGLWAALPAPPPAALSPSSTNVRFLSHTRRFVSLFLSSRGSPAGAPADPAHACSFLNTGHTGLSRRPSLYLRLLRFVRQSLLPGQRVNVTRAGIMSILGFFFNILSKTKHHS